MSAPALVEHLVVQYCFSQVSVNSFSKGILFSSRCFLSYLYVNNSSVNSNTIQRPYFESIVESQRTVITDVRQTWPSAGDKINQTSREKSPCFPRKGLT